MWNDEAIYPNQRDCINERQARFNAGQSGHSMALGGRREIPRAVQTRREYNRVGCGTRRAILGDACGWRCDMIGTNENDGLAPVAETAKADHIKTKYASKKALLQSPSAILKIDLGLAVWLWAYRIEEAREKHASSCNLWRQAGCCVGLAVFRIFGGR